MLKNIVIIALLLASLAMGVVLARQVGDRQARIVALEKTVGAQREEIKATRAQAAETEQKRQQSVARAKSDRQALREAREAAAVAQANVTPDPALAAEAATPTPADPKKSGNPLQAYLAKMMKDPGMKGMMRTTQSGMVKQLYGELVKKWALSPEETQTFYDLLLDKQSDEMERGMKLLENGSNSAVDAATQAMTVTEASDAKIKAALGDSLFQQYKEYETTMPGRFVLNQYQAQLASSNATALTPDQSQVMLQALNEEKINLPTDVMNPNDPARKGGFAFMQDPAQMDQYIKAQGELNERIDARVQYSLTPEQLKVLKDQQQQQLAMQRMGMEMTAKMLAPSPTP